MKYEYTFPVEELDRLIDQMNQGMLPAVPEEMKTEAKIRYKELQEELFDVTDDEIISEEEIKRHKEIMKQKIEEEKHKAHRDNIKIAKIGEKQKAKLIEAVSTSIVRPYYSDYNKTDEELYGDSEKRDIYQKLGKLKARYMNPYDYKTAMSIIQKAIKYSLDHDYPGQKKSDVYEAWRRGEIKVNIPIPKLFADYVHEITDKDILKGIIDGSVSMVTKKDVDSEMVKIDYSKSKLINIPYEVYTPEETEAMAHAHRRGYDTPMSMVFKNKSRAYNQFTIPSSNIFSNKYTMRNTTTGEPETFDFEQENAAMLYLEKLHGRDPFDVDTLIGAMNANNNNELSLRFRNCIRNGAVMSVAPMSDDVYHGKSELSNFNQPKDPSTLALEQQILRAIQESN